MSLESEEPMVLTPAEVNDRMTALAAVEHALQVVATTAARAVTEPDAESDPVRHALTLARTALTLGSECHEARPYGELILINDKTGLRLCCTHTPEHCRPV